MDNPGGSNIPLSLKMEEENRKVIQRDTVGERRNVLHTTEAQRSVAGFTMRGRTRTEECEQLLEAGKGP